MDYWGGGGGAKGYVGPSSQIIGGGRQSTLVISKSKGPSEILRDIRTSTYQMCRTEENTSRTTKFHKRTCNLTPLVEKYMLKILWKMGEIAPEEQFHPLSTIFYYLTLNFYVKTGIRFSL